MKRLVLRLLIICSFVLGLAAAACTEGSPQSTPPAPQEAPQAQVAPGGPFEGGSGPGYPTGPLDISMKANLTLNKLGQVKGVEGQQEIKARQYEGAGELAVTINGVSLIASQVTVTSNLKFKGGTAQHEGKADIEVNAPAAGHLTLEYRGTATKSIDPVEGDITITSSGTFKTVRTTGLFAGLVADGTYAMTIMESGQVQGSSTTVNISTRSGVQATLPSPPVPQPPAGGDSGTQQQPPPVIQPPAGGNIGAPLLPPEGTVTVKAVQYDVAKQQLQVELIDARAIAQTITVSVTSTGQTIGTLTDASGGKFKGEFSWPVNPENITITSSLSWSITVGVTVK